MTDSSATPRNNGERPLHEDDPLMELSRIFDFSVTAENDSAQNTQQADPDFGLTQDDFTLDSALDLERELMGDFSDFSESDFYPAPSGEAYSESSAGDDTQRVSGDVSFAENDLAAALEHELDVHMSEHELENSLHDLEFVEPVVAEPVPQFNYNDYSEARDAADAIVSSDDFASFQDQHETAETHSEISDFELTFDEQVLAAEPDFSEPQSQQSETYASQFSPENQWHNDPLQNQELSFEADTTSSPFSEEYSEAKQAGPALSLEDELQNLLFGGDQAFQSEVPAFVEEPENTVSENTSWLPLQSDNSWVQPVEHVEAEQDYPFEGVTSAPFNDEATEPFETTIAQQQFTASDTARSDAAQYPHYPRSNFSADAPVTSVLASEPRFEGVPEATPVSSDDYQLADDFSLSDDFALDFDNAAEPGTVEEASGDELSGAGDFTFDDSDFGFEASGDGTDAGGATDELVFNEEDFFSIDDLNLDVEDSPGSQGESVSYAHALEPEQTDDFSAIAFAPKFDPSVPEVETISVGESKVEQTHALDLPEVPYEVEQTNTGLSDLESEFAEVFNTIEIDDPSSRSEHQSEADKAFDDIFRENASSYLAAGAAAGVAAGAAAAYGKTSSSSVPQNNQYVSDTAGKANSDDFYNHWAASGAQAVEGNQSGADTSFGNEPLQEDLGSAADAYRERPVRGRRGLIVASIAGAAVLIGGIGYHFLSGGGSGEPVVIRASNDPVKVQPENPGGVTVPNQDKAVYDRVAGTLPSSPEQKSLIASGEEPVDLAATQDFSPAEEEMVDTGLPLDEGQNAPLIQPREVETMIVRPDGSIIAPPAQSTPPATTTALPAEPAQGELIAPPPENDEIAALAAGGVIQPANELTTAEQATPGPVGSQATVQLPAQAPLVPSRPSQQPMNVVGNVPQRTQAPATAEGQAQVASAAAAGSYFIQIASQPTPELAQRSYANMAQRYGNVIGGRAVDIKRADIPNKGTYYRVRVQAGTKEDANALCARLKTAGGSCFVTQ